MFTRLDFPREVSRSYVLVIKTETPSERSCFDSIERP